MMGIKNGLLPDPLSKQTMDNLWEITLIPKSDDIGRHYWKQLCQMAGRRGSVIYAGNQKTDQARWIGAGS